jgi:hypothetical protein
LAGRRLGRRRPLRRASRCRRMRQTGSVDRHLALLKSAWRQRRLGFRGALSRMRNYFYGGSRKSRSPARTRRGRCRCRFGRPAWSRRRCPTVPSDRNGTLGSRRPRTSDPHARTDNGRRGCRRWTRRSR